MTLLFDTSVIIGGYSSEGVDTGDAPAVSAVTVGELAYGLDTASAADRELRSRRLRVVLVSFEVIPFGVEEAKLYGVLSAMVQRSGRDPRPRRMDLQIAATAAAARCPVLTANPRDFEGLAPLVDVIPIA
ncbi:MAG: twitching motility protein PilT [Pseudonocardia sp. SCN 72-86]|nr:MAG: twitching motility protein PilT [Pseudonocardia sp. SCN 72-86]